MAQKKIHTEENTYQEISNYFIKWLGIVVCVLSLIGLFINSESILKLYYEAQEFRNDDSNIAQLLFSITSLILKVLVKLKKLPIAAKVIGLILGGILWITHNDD